MLAGLHGALNRGYPDLQALGADLDRLKYVRLPVERERREGRSEARIEDRGLRMEDGAKGANGTPPSSILHPPSSAPAETTPDDDLGDASTNWLLSSRSLGG